MIARLFILSVFAILLSCKSSKQASSEKYPIVMMERTTCMGDCPAFVFNVYPDGSATYEGKSNVMLMGNYTTTMSVEQLDILKNSFIEADFFKFADVYSANITDLPTTFIYYNDGKQSLKITDYYGAPEPLTGLEAKVVSFIEALEWQKL
jgi:hypothetical protein